MREKSPQKKERKIEGKKKEKDGGKEAGHGSFKTSSLFKHNPDIPDIHRYSSDPIGSAELQLIGWIGRSTDDG